MDWWHYLGLVLFGIAMVGLLFSRSLPASIRANLPTPKITERAPRYGSFVADLGGLHSSWHGNIQVVVEDDPVTDGGARVTLVPALDVGAGAGLEGPSALVRWLWYLPEDPRNADLSMAAEMLARHPAPLVTGLAALFARTAHVSAMVDRVQREYLPATRAEAAPDPGQPLSEEDMRTVTEPGMLYMNGGIVPVDFARAWQNAITLTHLPSPDSFPSLAEPIPAPPVVEQSTPIPTPAPAAPPRRDPVSAQPYKRRVDL